MAKYHISRKAIADLDSIWEYTAKEWSEQQASEYYRQLYFSIQNLSVFIQSRYKCVWHLAD